MEHVLKNFDGLVTQAYDMEAQKYCWKIDISRDEIWLCADLSEEVMNWATGYGLTLEAAPNGRWLKAEKEINDVTVKLTVYLFQ